MTNAIATDMVDAKTVTSNLLEEWLILYEQLPNARFYHHPHWITAIANHLAPAELMLGLGRINGELKLLIPLCNYRGQHRRQHPMHDHLSLNDVLIHPGLAHSSSLENHLGLVLDRFGDRWWDWQISNLPGNSQLATSLLQTEPSAKRAEVGNCFRPRAETRWLFKAIRESASFDSCAADCPPQGKLKRNLRRLRKQMTEHGEIRVELVDKPEQLERAFEHFLTIESSGWKGDAAISANAELKQFYRALLDCKDANLVPMINLLWCGDHCAAAQFALRTNNCISLLKIGYNEALARFSPGSLLLEDLIEHARCSKIDTVSLVTAPPWADRWHPQRVPVWHVTRFNNSAAGKTLERLEILKLAAKQRLKRAA